MPAGPPPSTTISNAPNSSVSRAGSVTLVAPAGLTLRWLTISLPPPQVAGVSVDLDVAGLDDRRPALDLAVDDRAELRRRIANRFHILRRQLVANRAGVERLDHILVYGLDDRRRRAARRDQA